MMQNTIVPDAGFKTRFGKREKLRHAVILGAGASKGLGVPLANDLLKEMILSSDKIGTTDLLRHPVRFLEDFFPRFRSGGDWYPSAEDLLGMLDVAEEYNLVRSRLRGNRWPTADVQTVRNHFLKHLGRYLWSFQDVFLNLREDNYLRVLVSAHRQSTVYVTFNYDLALEAALSLENIPYSYGLPMPRDGVTVLKPHGSINWFASNVLIASHSDKWFNLTDKTICCTAFHYSQLGRAQNRPPVIIPPSPTKQIALFDLKKLWTAFSSVVHNAPQILIAGYSLPDADRMSRFILRRAGRSVGVHHITVVNRSDVSEVYKKTISLECEFPPPTRFEDWVREKYLRHSGS